MIGMEPSVVTFDTLIRGLFECQQVDDALELFDNMLKGECYIKPNTQIFDTVISGLCENSRIDQAQDIFRTITSRGVSANVLTYNVLIGGLLKGMEEDKCEPDIVSFNILICGMCRGGDLEAAKGLFIC